MVTGYSVAEAEGTSIMHFVEPSMKQMVELNLLKALKGFESTEGEGTRVASGGRARVCWCSTLQVSGWFPSRERLSDAMTVRAVPSSPWIVGPGVGSTGAASAIFLQR